MSFWCTMISYEINHSIPLPIILIEKKLRNNPTEGPHDPPVSRFPISYIPPPRRFGGLCGSQWVKNINHSNFTNSNVFKRYETH